MRFAKLSTGRGPLQSTIATLLRRLAGHVLPPVCCLCDARGEYDPAGFALDLCSICCELLPKNANRCCRCATPQRREAVCRRCRRRPPPFDAVLAPYLYLYPVAQLVRGLKFHGVRAYGRLLGQLLAEAHLASGAPRPDALTAVPLHASRYRERGFNQAEEIARAAARTLAVPLLRGVLERRSATAEQSGLAPRERRRNVRGAFRIARPARVGCVALVDDVLTTGSTAAEASRMLKAAGVGRVHVWVAARA